MGRKLDISKLPPEERVKFMFSTGFYADSIGILCFDGQWQIDTLGMLQTHNQGPTDTLAVPGVMSQMAAYLRVGEDWRLDQTKRALLFAHNNHRSYFDNGHRERDIQLVTHTLCGGYKEELIKQIPEAVAVFRNPKRNWEMTLRVLHLQFCLEQRDFTVVEPWIKGLYPWVRNVELFRSHRWYMKPHQESWEELMADVTPDMLGLPVETNRSGKMKE